MHRFGTCGGRTFCWVPLPEPFLCLADMLLFPLAVFGPNAAFAAGPLQGLSPASAFRALDRLQARASRSGLAARIFKPNVTMKNPTPHLLALNAAIVLLAVAAPSARTCDACDGKQQIKIPDTAEGILKVLHEHHTAVRAAIGTNALVRASWIVISMQPLAKALPAKAPSDKKASVDTTVKSYSATAKELGKSALRDHRGVLAPLLARLDDVLKQLDAHFSYRPATGGAAKPGASGATNHFQHLRHDAPARSAAPGVVPGVE